MHAFGDSLTTLSQEYAASIACRGFLIARATALARLEERKKQPPKARTASVFDEDLFGNGTLPPTPTAPMPSSGRASPAASGAAALALKRRSSLSNANAVKGPLYMKSIRAAQDLSSVALRVFAHNRSMAARLGEFVLHISSAVVMQELLPHLALLFGVSPFHSANLRLIPRVAALYPQRLPTHAPATLTAVELQLLTLITDFSNPLRVTPSAMNRQAVLAAAAGLAAPPALSDEAQLQAAFSLDADFSASGSRSALDPSPAAAGASAAGGQAPSADDEIDEIED
jgi:hypothetical protein